MANTKQQNLNKWAVLIWALLLYFAIHEGAKILYALFTGTYVDISFISLQYEAKIDIKSMSHAQQCCFWLIGSIATTFIGYIFFILTGKLLKSDRHWVHAFSYYITIVFMLLDPVYLGIASLMIEGGDMSGINTVMNEQIVRLIAELISIVNVILILKYFLPKHKTAWKDKKDTIKEHGANAKFV